MEGSLKKKIHELFHKMEVEFVDLELIRRKF